MNKPLLKRITGMVLLLVMLLPLITGIVSHAAGGTVDIEVKHTAPGQSNIPNLSKHDTTIKTTVSRNITAPKVSGYVVDKAIMYYQGKKVSTTYSSTYRLNIESPLAGKGILEFQYKPMDIVVTPLLQGKSKDLVQSSKAVKEIEKNKGKASAPIQMSGKSQTIATKSDSPIYTLPSLSPRISVLDNLSATGTLKKMQWNVLQYLLSEETADGNTAIPNVKFDFKDNKIQGLDDSVIDKFLSRDKSKVDESLHMLMNLLNKDIEETYGKDPGLNVSINRYYYSMDGKNEYNKDFNYKHFLRTLGRYSTSVVFGKEIPLDIDVAGESLLGYPATNQLAPNAPYEGGDYSTKDFIKNPLQNSAVLSLLNRRNGMNNVTEKFNDRTGYELRLSEMYKKYPNIANKIVDSAIAGIEKWHGPDSAIPWNGKRTFNNKLGLSEDNEEMTSEKYRMWREHLIVTTPPTNFTRGEGIMARVVPGIGYRYVTVPLAPFMDRDIDISVELGETILDPNHGGYTTELKVKIDEMPLFPEENIDFLHVPWVVEMEDATIVSTNFVHMDDIEYSLDNEALNSIEWNKDKQVVSISYNAIFTEDEKEATMLVNWVPDDREGVDKGKLKFRAGILNDNEYDILYQSKHLTKNPEETGEYLKDVKDRGYFDVGKDGKFGKYLTYRHEKTYENNMVEDEKPPIRPNLYIDKSSARYKGSEEILSLKLSAGVQGRELRDEEHPMVKGGKIKPELPQEVDLYWETNDGQKGEDKIVIDELLLGEEQELEFELDIKNNPDKQIEVNYVLEINSEPRHPIEGIDGEIDPYEDNVITGKYTIPFKSLDLWAEAYEKQTKAEVDKDIPVKINVGLTNSEDDLTTNLIIYNQSGREVTRKNDITVVAGTGDIVEVIIDKGKISAGDNTFYAVINSDFNLTKGTPIETEEFLDNNKAEFVISLTDDDLIERSEGCSFSGEGETRTGIYYTCCSWGPKGCNSYGCCGKERLTLYHSSEIIYTSAELSSDSWHTMKDGQEFGVKKNLPTGLDLSSNPAKNNLMSAIGINPLRQVIASGHGIRVRGTIRIKGSAEDFDSPSTARIDRYVDDLIENSFVVGAGANFDESGGTAKLRNNEGVHFQKMELDTTRSSRRDSKSSSKPSGTAGSEDCTYIEKFRTEYDYEIPVIITQAKGKINEIGKNQSQWKNVPNERKFFTYLNELNGEYSMYLRADRNSSILGLVNGDIKSCNHKPNNFKMGIYGTMFEYPGVVISEPDKSIWDN